MDPSAQGLQAGIPVKVLEDLKVSCLSVGIGISLDALALLADEGPLTIHEYPTTGGMTLELPQRVYVNAPFDEWFCRDAEAELVTRDGDFAVEFRGSTVPVVRVLPLPGYLDGTDSEGRAVTDVVMSHADRVRLSPFIGCAYDCSFCDLGTMEYRARPLDQILEALDIAARDQALPPRHVLISGGSPRRPHYDLFEEICLGVVAATPMEVDVMMSPMIDNLGFLDRMAEAGLHGLAINIELFSAEASIEHLAPKYKSTRAAFDEFVGHAVEVFPPGRIRSLIIPGLESAKETLDGVAHLASLGCDPTLSPFRPARGIALERRPPPGAGLLAEMLQRSREIVQDHDVVLGPRCVPCQHNTLTFPWDVE